MKYAIVIPDGCADEPQESLGGKTPLEAARTPAMDTIASDGIVGRSSNVPSQLPAGSAVANMSLLGYDPVEHFTGRAPLEAAAQGIDIGDNDWVIRCNLVTIEDQIMRNFTADHIPTDEARQLLSSFQETIKDAQLTFVSGVSYRNLLLHRKGDAPIPYSSETVCTPPHDLTDKSVMHDYPRGPGSYLLCDLMSQSAELFANHPVNERRRAAGKLPATNVWLWGLGQRPRLEPFETLHHKSGKMITAVDLLRGLAALIGWDRIEVPGATGYTDTDYKAKGESAVAAVPACDIICVHIEAPDEASHEGDIPAKIKAIEEIDRSIVQPLHDALKQQGQYRILISPDHPTPVRTKTHSHGYVPWTISGTGIKDDGLEKYNESMASQSNLAFDEGHRLMRFFLDE